MTDAIKLGEPIPLGIVSRHTAVLGDEQTSKNTETGGEGTESVANQLASLREEIAALKLLIADTGKGAAAAVEAHPYITASIVSLGAWALIAMAYRRYRYALSDIYPSIRDRFDNWH